MRDEVLEAVQHLANCQGPCMDGKSLRLVTEHVQIIRSQNQALQEEHEDLLAQNQDLSVAVKALQERAERAEAEKCFGDTPACFTQAAARRLGVCVCVGEPQETDYGDLRIPTPGDPYEGGEHA